MSAIRPATGKSGWARFKASLSGVPAPLGGLALGLASLGVAWGILVPDLRVVFKLLTTPLAALLVVLVVLKYYFHPRLVREDLKHTVISSVMPTLAMATMVIAASIYELSPAVSRALWLFAVVAHLCLFIAFLWHRAQGFHITHMVPSWFVPPVGIVVACVTGGAMGFPGLTRWIFVFGLSVYAIILPVMLYRLVFHERISEAASPTFAIMAAPASLVLAGYLTISGDIPNMYLVAVLAPIAVLMTGIVWMAMFHLLRLPFSPGYAAFTFPMVIGATALLKLEVLLHALGYDYPVLLLSILARLELLVATAVVMYVAARYVMHYRPALNKAV